MPNHADELFIEINQLLTQYRQEVPGRRRAWPESIKSRVVQLRSLGVKFAQISERTTIPYHTVLQWRSKSTDFTPVKIVNRRQREIVPTVTVKDPKPDLGTVTVTTPSGIRVEGVGRELLLEILSNLEAR